MLLGCSKRTLIRWERGQSSPRLEFMANLSSALQLPIDSLLTQDGMDTTAEVTNSPTVKMHRTTSGKR
jgi:transcriptional regulator with XRE-family HTH domain